MPDPHAQVEVTLGEAGARAYPVLIGADLLPRLTRFLPPEMGIGSFAVISDEDVARLHAPGLLRALRSQGVRAELFTFPPGEGRKTREWWARLTDWMLEAGFGRDSAVIALGGGVTGDLAGFVAATYMRGVPLVQLPTSLLAMIDSSVGGKTGVDSGAGKNVVGAFHQPLLVLADIGTLATLPPRHLAAGMAEAVKHGAIADAEYLEWVATSREEILGGGSHALTQLVERSVRIKAAIVERDELESGERKALNFGHTIAHALETLSGYTLLHGEAVAIGMVVEARVGEAIGVTAPGCAERLVSILHDYGLPTSHSRMDLVPEAVLQATRGDKKVRRGRVEYALLERVGRAVWSVPVPDGAVLEVLGS